MFLDACRSNWIPGRECALDEQMVLCKSRYAGIKTRVPNKPIRMRLKIFAICDSVYARTYVLTIRTEHNDTNGRRKVVNNAIFTVQRNCDLQPDERLSVAQTSEPIRSSLI